MNDWHKTRETSWICGYFTSWFPPESLRWYVECWEQPCRKSWMCLPRASAISEMAWRHRRRRLSRCWHVSSRRHEPSRSRRWCRNPSLHHHLLKNTRYASNMRWRRVKFLWRFGPTGPLVQSEMLCPRSWRGTTSRRRLVSCSKPARALRHGSPSRTRNAGSPDISRFWLTTLTTLMIFVRLEA